MLNPELVQMIAYCKERNIGTEFPTTLSVKLTDEQIEQIILSGLDHLIVSIDGTTQEVYEEYRRGASLERVLENVSRLLAARQALSSKVPFIEFKFVLFDHNRHQLEDARDLARRLKFDKFSVVRDTASPVTRHVLKEARLRNLAERRACFWPWSSMVIRWDGTVRSCCTTRVDMGNAFETPIAEIWNSEGYQRLRSFFRTHESDEWSRTCKTCMEF
jgi:radical SAM protein with 4Fe4S-binding SPASM domain